MAKAKTFLKRTAIIMGALIAAFLIINAFRISMAARRFESRLAEIRSAGDPVALTDLEASPPPPDENAAVLLRRAERDLDAVSTELNRVYSRDGFVEGQLEPEDFDATRNALQAYPNLIPLLERAAESPGYHPQRDYSVDGQSFLSDLLEVQFARQATRVLVARAHLSASQGDLDEALRTCLTMFQLCRHFDQEPALLSHLVALACRSTAVAVTNVVLRSGSIPLERRDSLDAELARHADSVGYVHALKTERAVGLTLFQMYLDHFVYWPVRASFLNDANAYLDLIQRQIQLADEPYRDYLATEQESEQTGGMLAPLTGSVRPALMQGRLATDRVQAMLRCLRVLNAVQAHVERTGETQVTLNDLGLPDEATTDPFTAGSLHLKRTNQGWIVWSVGENLRDDGGMLKDYLDIGVGPLRSAEEQP